MDSVLKRMSGVTLPSLRRLSIREEQIALLAFFPNVTEVTFTKMHVSPHVQEQNMDPETFFFKVSMYLPRLRSLVSWEAASASALQGTSHYIPLLEMLTVYQLFIAFSPISKT